MDAMTKCERAPSQALTHMRGQSSTILTLVRDS
jgi:hypothetical protein